MGPGPRRGDRRSADELQELVRISCGRDLVGDRFQELTAVRQRPRGAHAVACRASGCVAVGGFHIDNWLSLDGWGEVLSIGVAVWASDAQGNWSLAAAKPLPQLGDNGGGAKKKVKTKVTAAATRKGKRATKITGMVSATNGCKASRKVRLLGKGDRVVATTQTKPNGSYSFALNANRHKNLRAKAAIRVTKREKATVVCQAANSQQVRVRWK
ncbi:MAG: hypothetical protein HZY75_15775 [Nocardioidaceae bacterium]|nr:MAG: hypothetical protein HZY75_15775 [Nocardioidaceae bacterium]